ncbi:DUF6518 family protein [Crossiella cryophila]|uniref:Uncharacterized protein n=1 Tax=Crossiella cryophila TaxID=43355 RepID=A0A7W7CJX5_9PSEU|nr:DUF6518 family protein [Crossiella cryophila]MBB4681166.1 hypothetical protein [Crossiella cryophila]
MLPPAQVQGDTRTGRDWLIVTLAGLLLGGVTFLLQATGLTWLANSTATWAATAYLVGTLTSWSLWRSPLYGVTTLWIGLTVWYVGAEILPGHFGWATLGEAGIWLGAAVMAGSVFGYAGACRRYCVRPWSFLGIGVIGGVLLWEGLYRLFVLAPDQPGNTQEIAGGTMLGCGVLAALLLPRTLQDRWYALGVTAAVTALGAPAAPLFQLILESNA